MGGEKGMTSFSVPDEALIQASCSISIGGQLKGTGWLIDEEGHILTAGHALEKLKPADVVQVRFIDDDPVQARLVQCVYDWDRGRDCALLALDAPSHRKPLPLNLARNVSGPVKLYGFGKTLVDLAPGIGEALGPFHPSNKFANRLFALQSHQTEQGYSGAAVYSQQLQAVVGIQMEGTTVPGYAPQGTTALAMPLYRIAEEFPDLPILSKLNESRRAAKYWYHVYLSYDRGGPQETWVDLFLKEELSMWLQVELGAEPSLFYDRNPKRELWDKDLMDAIKRSSCLVPILTPSYWRSSECLAELESFRVREKKENVAVTYGILFNKRGAVPEGTKLPVHDFTRHTFTYQGFRKSDEYGGFQNSVKEFAGLLANLISNAPECESSWPVSVPSAVVIPPAAREFRIERPR
jgi:hypothetical protein